YLWVIWDSEDIYLGFVLLFEIMNRKFILFFGLILLFCFPVRSWGTHAAGSELIYEWLRDSTYRFYFKFFRDCSGTSVTLEYPMCYFNPCDGTYGQVALRKMSLLANNQPNGLPVSTG